MSFVVVLGRETAGGNEDIVRMYGPFSTRTVAARFRARVIKALAKSKRRASWDAWIRIVKPVPKHLTRTL
jgi:hypothetical protein